MKVESAPKLRASRRDLRGAPTERSHAQNAPPMPTNGNQFIYLPSLRPPPAGQAGPAVTIERCSS